MLFSATVWATVSLLFTAHHFHLASSCIRRKESPSASRGNYPNPTTKHFKFSPHPAVSTDGGELEFRIGVIADFDKKSKNSSKTWVSHLKRGSLVLHYDNHHLRNSKVSIQWDTHDETLSSELSQAGRGMELSDLQAFQGSLYTCDDRTGIVYALVYLNESQKLTPIAWVILPDGDGVQPKGFKCEWMTVKDDFLFVGGLGKEWTNPAGQTVNFNPQYVKQVSAEGQVRHLDWRTRYNKMVSALGISFPGYVIHEAGGWSKILEKWVFLPRRVSLEPYVEKRDESKGSNVMIVADENFETFEIRHIGFVTPTRGFSSFKWIPGTQDQLVVALKSEEVDDLTASYVMVFDMEGHILLNETKIGDHKYEGIEFI